MTTGARVAGGALALMTAGLAYAAAEARWFTLRRMTVPVLPPLADPVKLLHISDLHVTAGQQRKAAWVAALARLEPDLVVTTGDNLGGPDALPRLETALGPLLDLPGAFVFGSNDYFSSRPKNPLAYLWSRSDRTTRRRPDLPWAALRQLLLDRGWREMNNARAVFPLAAGLVELVGLGDPHMGLDRMPTPWTVPNTPGTGSGPPLVKLGLVHAPYCAAIRALVLDGASLVLAGHTHGGQVAVPLHGALVSNCDLPPRFAKGLHRLTSVPPQSLPPEPSASPAGVSPGWAMPDPSWPSESPSPPAKPSTEPTMPDHQYLHVSAGLGTSPYSPIRFACRPEASLLTLVPTNS